MAASTPVIPTPRSAFSRQIFMSFRRAYGPTPRTLDFLLLFEELRLLWETLHDGSMQLDAPDESDAPDDPGADGDLSNRFRMASSVVLGLVNRNDLYMIVETESRRILPIIRRIGHLGAKVASQSWRLLALSYAEMLRAALADKGTYTKLTYLQIGDLRWPQLRMASVAQETVEKLKYDDPELYTRTVKNREQTRDIERSIVSRIDRDGLKPGKANVFGRIVNTGLDPVTGERIVYDLDGTRTTLDAFYDKLRKTNDEYKEEIRVNPKSLKDFKTMRTVPESRMAELDGTPKDQIRYVSLSDDPDKSSALTRIYPTVEIDGVAYVQSGRFKGLAVPDLVNRAGRLIEGSIYYYDTETGRTTRREIAKKDGTPSVRRQEEPYITLTKHKGKTKLLLNVQSTGPWTETRNALAALAKVQPSIIYIDGSRKSSYMFDPKDFGAIRKRLGGLAMSNAAAKFIKNYFDELLRAQQAAESEDLARFDDLGLKRPLWRVQKKALAWLEANGDRGVCALDVGLGKTTVAIATIQNLIKRGLHKTGNGRFLFICEKALRGNFANEVNANLRGEKGQYEAARIIEMTDVMLYPTFTKERKANPTFGDDYIAVFFDEAHLHLVKRSSAKYKAATAVKCPRKIILSASPIITTPRDMFTMASVTQGVDLNTREGRLDERLFINRFAKKVGNRIVGVTDDPDLEEDMRTWVKRNVYYADKRDPETQAETKLPPVTVVPPIALSMDPEVEVVYRETMNNLLDQLKTVANKGIRQNTPIAVEASRVKLAKLIALLTKLSDTPGAVVPGYDRNPKVEQAAKILRDKISGKTLLFTDSPALAEDSFERLSDEFPGRVHALALASEIKIRDALGQVKSYRERVYTDPDTGAKTKPADWATLILQKIIQRDPLVMTLTLTGKYAVGQNLQEFSSVIHLDRDSWSNEAMKQRTGRAWRSGQRQSVDEYKLDMVYGDPKASAKNDQTLDEIRKYLQEMDAGLFDSIIKDSKDFVLGETWTGLRKQRSLTYQLDRKMIERALSPYANQLGRNE